MTSALQGVAFKGTRGDSFGTLADTEAGRPFTISAHRGDIGSADSYPENTLEAFRQAAIKGAHRVEIDVQLSSQGTPYCIHDATATRTTDGTGNIADKTDAQMDALNIDAGHGYDAGRHGTSLNVPTLISVLDALRPYGVGIDLDMKTTTDAASAAVAQIVVDRGIEHRTQMQAPSLTAASAIKSVSSRILVGTFTAVSSAPQSQANVDVWWAEQDEVTQLSDVTSRAPDFVWAFYSVDDGVGTDESTIIANMFTRGVRTFCTNNLEDALAQRATLLSWPA